MDSSDIGGRLSDSTLAREGLGGLSGALGSCSTTAGQNDISDSPDMGLGFEGVWSWRAVVICRNGDVPREEALELVVDREGLALS